MPRQDANNPAIPCTCRGSAPPRPATPRHRCALPHPWRPSHAGRGRRAQGVFPAGHSTAVQSAVWHVHPQVGGRGHYAEKETTTHLPTTTPPATPARPRTTRPFIAPLNHPSFVHCATQPSLFRCSDATRTYWFNPASLVLDGELEVEYALVGALLGLAIYNGKSLGGSGLIRSHGGGFCLAVVVGGACVWLLSGPPA